MNKISWKNNAPFALCLTHDVDRIKKYWYHYAYYAYKGSVKRQLNSFKEKLSGIEPYDNIKSLMEFEQKNEVKSTFFFLNETKKEFTSNFMGRYKIKNKKIVNSIKMLNKNGFEVGLHGSYYSYNNLELLKNEKSVLENILGRKIVSARQHHLNFDENLTLKHLREIGILNDSTIGFSQKTGISLPCFPYKTQENILEFPITVMDTLDFSSKSQLEEIWKAVNNTIAKNGLIVLDFHQCKFNKIDYPHSYNFYCEIVKMARDNKAYIAPMCELGEYVRNIREMEAI